MTTETKNTLSGIIANLEELRNDIYNFDYDRENLWYLAEAIKNLRRME